MGTHAKLTSRLTAFVLLLFVLVGALGWRLVDFQVVRAEEIQEKSLERPPGFCRSETFTA